MTQEKYLERLIELLKRKKTLLLDMLSFTQAQTDAITQDGLDGLGDLINKKQEKIDAIDQIDEEFDIYFSRFKSTMGISKLDQLNADKLEGSASDSARQMKELTAEIMDVIQTIREVEKVNSQKSNQLLGQFGNEIKKINQSKMVNNAYRAAPANAPSYFLDKKK